MTIVTELPGMRLPIDPVTDLTAIALVARTTYGLAVARSSRWRSVAEIIAAARATPGALTYANPGLGTVQHLASEYLKQRMDVDIVQVPYRGSGQAILDMMAGRTDIIITNLADMMGQIRSGHLRLLALGDPMGRRFFPEMPMVADEVPGFETNGWFALCAPPGLPDAASLRWQDAARRALNDESVQRKLIENGLVATFQDAGEVNRMMDKARRTYREIIRAAGIRAD
jgi:tripartite-type tricarboxylate transporter receptor subunit TctC